MTTDTIIGKANKGQRLNDLLVVTQLAIIQNLDVLLQLKVLSKSYFMKCISPAQFNSIESIDF